MIQTLLSLNIETLFSIALGLVAWLTYDFMGRMKYKVMRVNHQRFLAMFYKQKEALKQEGKRVMFINSVYIGEYANRMNISRKDLKALLQVMDDSLEACNMTLVMI